MIVPMKKYTFLVYHKEYQQFLEDIRQLGMLHVIEKQSGEIEDEGIREAYQKINELNAAIKFLSRREVETAEISNKKDGLDILRELNKIQTDEENYRQKLVHLKKEKLIIEPWGNFNRDSINNLKDAGLIVEFYICLTRSFDPEWDTLYNIATINELAGQKYFVLIRREDEEVDIHAENISLPETSLSKLNKEIAEIEAIIERTAEIYDKFAASYLPTLKEAKDRLSAELDFEKVILNTQKEADDKLMLLEGWVPREREKEINEFLKQSDVYFQAEKPTPKDNVPVLLKNKKFPRLFEVIGELYSMPNYRELDLTPFFAPFFMMFFGFCLGDAGYGLIFILAATYFKFKVDQKFKPLLSLIQWLGLATVIFGAITGTIFGMNLIDSGYIITDHSIKLLQQHNLPADIIARLQELIGMEIETKDAFIKELAEIFKGNLTADNQGLILKYAESRYSFLNSFRYLLLDPNKMFYLALALGGIQIIFGMCIKAANQARMFGIRYAFSTIGWIIVILSGIILFGLFSLTLLNADTAKKIFYIVLGIGSLGIFFFNDPKRNILINVGSGLWDTYNMVTGMLGDLLSYIRLFALGIASAILGFVFNDLAMNMSPDVPVVGQLVFVIILLIGHGINIFMSSLGSFVHPLRLTFVEFYKNSGYIGGGKKYNPFSKK